MRNFLFISILLLFITNTHANDFCLSEVPSLISEGNNQILSTNYSVHQCSIDHLCFNSKRDQFWAQKRVDGDLMLSRVAELDNIDTSSGVAVIDSGFDESGSIDGLHQTPRYVVNYNFSKVPRVDYGHHGTAVTGLIGGKEGVGLAPNSPLYIYNFYSEIKNDQQAGLDAINDACDRGVPIINFSYYPKVGDAKFYFRYDIIDSLKKRGCILIISAGNDGYKKDLTYNKPNDSIITVRSTNTFHYKSNFSNEGEIAAPGEFVYTLNSKEGREYKERISMSNESCDGSVGPAGKMQSGTSFGAPIVTAITKQVESILRAGPGYLNIPPENRVDLITSIISASSVNGVINGYRAVEMAILFNKKREGVSPKLIKNPYKFSLFKNKEINPDSFINFKAEDFNINLSIKYQSLCKSNELICDNNDQCEFKKCYDNLRKKQAICKKVSSNELSNILNQLERSGNIDALSRFYSTKYSGDPLRKTYEEMIPLFEDYLSRPEGPYKDLLLSSIFRYLGHDLSKKLPDHIQIILDEEGMRLLKEELVSADTVESINQIFLIKIRRDSLKEKGRDISDNTIDKKFWKDFLSLPNEKVQFFSNKSMRQGITYTVPKGLIEFAQTDLHLKSGDEFMNSLHILNISNELKENEVNIILNKIITGEIDFDYGVQLLSIPNFTGKRALAFFKKHYKKIAEGLMGDQLVLSLINNGDIRQKDFLTVLKYFKLKNIDGFFKNSQVELIRQTNESLANYLDQNL